MVGHILGLSSVFVLFLGLLALSSKFENIKIVGAILLVNSAFLFISRFIPIPSFTTVYEKMKAPEVKLTKKPEELYKELLHWYVNIHGSFSRHILEDDMKSLMKFGFSREEAIIKLAVKEKLIELKKEMERLN